MNHTPIRLLATAGLIVLAGALQAAPPKKEGTLGGGKGSGPVLKIEELRACIIRHDKLQAQREATLKAQAEVKAQRAGIDEGAAALKTATETVDKTSQDALNALLEQAKAQDKRVDDYQARVTEFNNQAEALNTEQAAYAKACEGRRYHEDDLKDIKAGK
jgi:hypothetical protein